MKNLITLYAYRFLFMDKNNNIIETLVKKCWNKKDAMKIAKDLFATSNDSELFRIKTQKSFLIKKQF